MELEPALDDALRGSGWEELLVELPVPDAIGTNRLHLPLRRGKSLEIGLIEFTAAEGGSVGPAWDFRD